MFKQTATLLLLAAAPAFAQVQSRPTDPPLVTAVNESWYQFREPIQFAGDLYYPAGPAVFFNGNVMARAGHYNGVPLYVDTTIEPFSVVLVPASRGLMQPYERLRRGDLAGTTGSRTPSFPVRGTPEALAYPPQAAVSPTQTQLPIGAISAYTLPGPAQGTTTLDMRGGERVTAPAPPDVPRQDEPPIVSLLPPENNDGLWVRYAGEKWVSAGRAVPLRAAEFRRVGDYAGFPVFARQAEDDRIYLPTRAGLVAPYRRK